MASVVTKVEPVNFTNFGRIGKIELLENGRPMSDVYLDGLDFKFRTSELYLAYSPPATATVDILGLSKDTIDRLCRFCDDAAYMERNISVRIKAGYATDKREPQMVLHMPVYRATPSMPPDNWLTLSCRNSTVVERLLSYEFELDYTNGKTKSNAFEVIKDVGESFGISFIWHTGSSDAAEKHQVDYFGVDGGPLDALEAVRKRFNFLKFIQVPGGINKKSGLFMVYDVWVSSFYERDEKTGKWKWTEEFVDGHSWFIDMNNGMIGLPSFVPSTEFKKMVKVRTLLNPSIRRGDIVNLTSRIAKGLNDVYRVFYVSHSGHLRGNEWYTDITMFANTEADNKAAEEEDKRKEKAQKEREEMEQKLKELEAQQNEGN